MLPLTFGVTRGQQIATSTTRPQPIATRPRTTSSNNVSSETASFIGVSITVLILLSMISCALYWRNHQRLSQQRSARTMRVQQNAVPVQQNTVLHMFNRISSQGYSKSECTVPSGTLIDQAPPSYNVALGLPTPTNNDHITMEPSVDPPPYSGPPYSGWTPTWMLS